MPKKTLRITKLSELRFGDVPLGDPLVDGSVLVERDVPIEVHEGDVLSYSGGGATFTFGPVVDITEDHYYDRNGAYLFKINETIRVYREVLS